MDAEFIEIALRLGAAWLAGSALGLERSFHGRPAGFRTHAIVCLASALLMAVTVLQWEWLSDVPSDAFRGDPARMAQGIMTGIGFLGAGVIFKDGLTVRGLTTAASIWITAAIGILFGVGLFEIAALATVVTFGTLAFFRVLEEAMPTHHFAHLMLRFAQEQRMTEEAVRILLKEHRFSVANFNYRLDRADGFFEYRMVIRTLDKRGTEHLAQTLASRSDLVEFRISPTGD
jgi:putative Mg2+ transporter-C (MgtC) family protein